MVTTFGSGVKAPLSMFCKATKTPEATVAAKVPLLTSAHEPMTMVAPGAAALAHSASRIDSTSTNATAPGSVQLFVPPGGGGWNWRKLPLGKAVERPKVLRKVSQSPGPQLPVATPVQQADGSPLPAQTAFPGLKTSLSSTTAMISPSPEMPSAKSGFKS